MKSDLASATARRVVLLAIAREACAVAVLLIYRNVSWRDICDDYKRSIFREGAMVIDILRQEHRNIETLLLVLERELGVFARGERPDCLPPSAGGHGIR